MKNIIIFGPPGAGKGTMSEKIAEEFEVRHISTGDIIRKNQADKTKIGMIADKIVDDGGFLPDNIINEMMKQEIIDDKKSKGFLFDGFPRTAGQAKMLDQFLNKAKIPVNIVIYLDADKHIVKKRIIERGKTSGRADDNDKVFETRWAKYMKETIPVINYFEGRGKVRKINGRQSIEDVYSDVKKVICDIYK